MKNSNNNRKNVVQENWTHLFTEFLTCVREASSCEKPISPMISS